MAIGALRGGVMFTFTRPTDSRVVSRCPKHGDLPTHHLIGGRAICSQCFAEWVWENCEEVEAVVEDESTTD